MVAYFTIVITKIDIPTVISCVTKRSFQQVSAMLSILDRYKLRQFGIVTSEIAGHDDFVQAVRERVHELTKDAKGGTKG